jgi:GTP-binding protein
LGKFTNARPKIAPYPFTTKIPNLGVLTLGAGGGEERDIVLADIPGLIRGASEGAGLGLRFLKHISRTAGLLFLIDLSDDTYSLAFDILYNEIGVFSPDLIGKKRIIVGTKTDLEGTLDRLEELRKKYPRERVFGISVFSGDGIGELARAIGVLVNETDPAVLGE